MDVRVGLWRRLSAEELMLLNCGPILKEINPGISLEGMMLKRKLQYFATSCEELTHWKRLWCWEGLGTGGKGDDKGWDGWMASPTQWTYVWVNWELMMDREAWHAAIHEVTRSWTWLSDWTELILSTPRNLKFILLFYPWVCLLPQHDRSYLSWFIIVYWYCIWGLKCFSCGSDDEVSACNAGDPDSVSGSWRSSGEVNGNLLQYSYLGNPLDRGAWGL